MSKVIRYELREMLTICVSVFLLSFSFYSSDTAAQQCCGEVFNVNYSTSADRSGGLGLQGATVTGNIHVFVNPIAPSSGILKVKWYLDSPIDQANIFRVDTAAPYDLIGGNGVAIPLDTTTLADGEHTITAKIVFGGSPRVRQDVTVTFTVGNDVVPPPATGSWEFGVAETPDRLFAAAEMFPDPTGVLELFFGQVFVFIGESNTCNLTSCIPVTDPQNPPPPVITAVTFTFDIGTAEELVVNTDTLAPYDLGGNGADPANPGFNLDDLPIGVHTLTATIEIVGGDPVTLTRTFLTQPLIAILPPTLKGEVPLEDAQLAEGTGGIIADNGAAIALGKSLFWDLQTGGDGRQACATCHYHAGVDNRVLNTVNPKSGGFEVDSGGPGGTLLAADFDFHNFVDPLDRGSDINRSIDDVVGSQGLVQKDFAGINVGSDEDSFVDPIFPDLNFVDNTGKSHRRVTGRNTPTNINAAFNVRSFWDGRANFVFNGVNPFGARDPGAVVYVDSDGVGGSAPVGEQLRIRFASLASQAVGPPNNGVEMSYAGRSFPELGRKLLNLAPLQKQLIDADDSVFGPSGPLGCIVAGGCGSAGMGLDGAYSYAALIMLAFDPKYWDGDNVMIDGTSYTLMEANFSMFFGLAIQKWEFTLVSDDSKWDRFREGTPGMTGTQQQKIDLALALLDNNEEPGAVAGNTAPFDPADILTNAETRGMNSFLGGACNACHGGAVLSAATTPFILGAVPAAEPVEQVVERMLMEQGVAALELGLPAPSAMYDIGFYNIAVRPTLEDLGVGGQDDFGNPLSFSSQLQSGIHVDDGLDAPIPGALPLPDFLVVDPNLFVRSPGASTIGAPIAINGAFKVPTLRNIELTAPYMHNGGTMSLENVVAFYARGADFLDVNIADVDPEVGGIGNLRGNPAGVADLVAFMRTFTDHRVKEEKAPFDHPGILLENGVVVEAVGASGLGTALPTFADRLNGPTAVADDYVIDVDEVLVDNVLDNDSDGDGDTVQNPLMISMEGPFNGTLNELNADGSFTYTPDGSFRGVDGFAYDMDTTNAADPRSNVARVTIQVGSAVPVANPDMYNTGFETPLAVPAPGVLGNDDDPDSPMTAVLSGAAPANALAFGLNLDGSFSYTPNPGFSGPDTFMYTANDADGPSAPAMVTIEVAPDATPCPTDGQIWLCYSLSADRSNPLLLDGGTVSGPIYVFKTPIVPTSPIIKVKWYMDSDITQGNLLSSDSTAPYDFNGGSPVDLSPGSHTITGKVVFDTSPRTRQDFPATFTVE